MRFALLRQSCHFLLYFKEITQNEQDFEVKGYHIHAFRVQHNVTCYGYTIQIPRAGRFHAEKAKELGIPLTFWSHLQKGETMTDGDKVYTPDMVMGEKEKESKLRMSQIQDRFQLLLSRQRMLIFYM